MRFFLLRRTLFAVSSATFGLVTTHTQAQPLPEASTEPGAPSAEDAPVREEDPPQNADPPADASPRPGEADQTRTSGAESADPRPAPEAQAEPPERSPEVDEVPLKARLDAPKPAPPSRAAQAHLPRSALRPEQASDPTRPAPRTEVMPGDYVARPVTLPRGTFKMEFGQGLVLWDTEPQSALAPVFALGITERIEIGVDAPLHYDPGVDEWAALHPRPHAGVTWIDSDTYELGTRVRALVPARPSLGPSLALAVPVLWRLSSAARLDLIPEFHAGLDQDDRAVVARVGGHGSWQLSPSVFAGLGGTAQIGFLDSRDSGFDPEVLLGFTHQNYGRSFVDFVTRVFAQGLGGADAGHVSKGAGFSVALTFYPELY